MKNASVQGWLESQFGNVTDGQFQEINRAVLVGVMPFIARLRESGRAQRFASGSLVSDAVSAALLSLLPKRVKMASNEVEWWQRYYHDNYYISAELGELEVPALVEYSTRLNIMHETVSGKCNLIAKVYEKRCVRKGFGWYQFNSNLDGRMRAKNPHARSGTYGIRVRDCVDAEYGFADGRNLSSQDVWDRGALVQTLSEGLIDADAYLLKTGEHLNWGKINICAGSVLMRGEVPSVDYRSSREVCVGCLHARDAGVHLRFRPVID